MKAVNSGWLMADNLAQKMVVWMVSMKVVSKAGLWVLVKAG